MKKNKVTQKEIMLISASMFVIVLVWISLTIYSSWVTSTISGDLKLQIIPIASRFDTQTLNNLKSREKIEPLSGSVIQATATPTPTVTPSASPEESQVLPTETPTPTEEIIPTEEPLPTEEPIPAL